MNTINVVRFENVGYGAIFMNMSNHRHYVRINLETETSEEAIEILTNNGYY